MSNNQLTLTQQVQGYLQTNQIKDKLNNLFSKDDKKIERFKSALINISLDSSLKDCTAQSIFRSALILAEVGLDINKSLSQAYILKYKNDAEPVISYKGWQTLIERTGKKVKAFSVFKCDTFEMDLSDFDEKIIFIPNLDSRKSSDDKWYKENLKGILVKIKSDDSVKNIFVSVDKIEKIKGMSKSLKGSKPEFSPYNNWAEEMYLAKAIKYVLSREALNFKEENLAKAIEVDNQLDTKISIDNIKEKKDDLENLMQDDILEVEAEKENNESE